ncbi:hypothetical protein QEN19_002130 [Hanseniaspora menglaensis]
MDANPQPPPNHQQRLNSGSLIGHFNPSIHPMEPASLPPLPSQNHSTHMLNSLQFKQHSNNSRNPSNVDFLTANPNDHVFQQRQGSNVYMPGYRLVNAAPLQQISPVNHIPQSSNFIPQRFPNSHYGNVIGDDNDISTNLKPLFKNYNIDVTQWPLTNPPIFENIMPGYDVSEQSTAVSFGQEGPDVNHPFHFMSDKDRRRRRVSISNGQIDQLNNDALQMDQLYCSQPPIYPRLLMNPNLPLNNMVRTTTSDNMSRAASINNSESGKRSNTRENSKDTITGKNDDDKSDTQKNVSKSTGKKAGAKRILPPSNTLIPGTPEYKKARLLERNRIAAMKCRQRKKLEHDLMERDYDKIMAENRELKKKIQSLEALLNNKQ